MSATSAQDYEMIPYIWGFWVNNVISGVHDNRWRFLVKVPIRYNILHPCMISNVMIPYPFYRLLSIPTLSRSGSLHIQQQNKVWLQWFHELLGLTNMVLYSEIICHMLKWNRSQIWGWILNAMLLNTFQKKIMIVFKNVYALSILKFFISNSISQVFFLQYG